jgi:hypothetical protein
MTNTATTTITPAGPESQKTSATPAGYTQLPHERLLNSLYRRMYVDPTRVAAVRDIRRLDREDGRVKKLHKRMAGDITRGGLQLNNVSNNRQLSKIWKTFVRSTQLGAAAKLRSDARGMLVEGNLAIQWVLDPTSSRVMRAVRMPSDTLVPQVNDDGQWKDPADAWHQLDDMRPDRIAAKFAQWQLTVARLDPDNYDDMGSMGRPMLDALRRTFKQLDMTEQDQVIRRRYRAPLRHAHLMEQMEKEEFDEYVKRVESAKGEMTTDYYIRGKGRVDALQGDSNLDQIGDITHLLKTAFAGTDADAGLMGYTSDLNRDVLEDIKRFYFEAIDDAQELVAEAYAEGFRLHLLLQGRDPDRWEWGVKFADRRTETPSQAADRALKMQAMGVSQRTVLETAGLDPDQESERLQDEAEDSDLYPRPDLLGPSESSVKITPNNAPKGESATSIAN